MRDPISKGLHPRMQLAAHHSPRVRWLKTLLEILHQGERPTRVRNKDPLKPLPVPGKFLRPIVDPERAPPRPKDGIGI